MKYIVPQFYKDFHCTADRCQHTCCAGWEIDIDSETYSAYQNVGDAFGKRLAKSIEVTANGAAFRLDEQERCPFLNSNNLCDIILTLGENALCQICRDHPRFRNFFSDRTEIGLGLCCEAAGMLLLSSAEKIQFVQLTGTENERDSSPTTEEIRFYAFRDELFAILQNRRQPIEKRLQAVLTHCNTALPQVHPARWAEIFLNLERLDDAWTQKLHNLQTAPPERFSICLPSGTDILFEHLAVYFIYRHLSDALTDGLLAARTAFSILSVQMIVYLCKQYFAEHNDLPLSAVVELARLYSSEIEYSQENINVLLMLLQN